MSITLAHKVGSSRPRREARSPERMVPNFEPASQQAGDFASTSSEASTRGVTSDAITGDVLELAAVVDDLVPVEQREGE